MTGLSCDGSEAMEIAMFLLPPHPGVAPSGYSGRMALGLGAKFSGEYAMGPAHAAPHIQPAGQSELHGPSTIEANLELV